MPSPPLLALRRSAGEPFAFVFLLTVVLCLLRARDLPSVGIGASGTTLSVGPADVALGVTAVLAMLRLRTRGTLPSAWLVGAATLFAALILGSSFANGADAIAAAGKLVVLAALMLGAVAFLDDERRLAALAAVVVAFTVVATGWALVGFVTGGGGRQASFLGEHDFAAVATMTLTVGLAALFVRPGWPAAPALVAVVAGTLGIALAASLASLLGLYLAAAALGGLAAARRSLRPRAVAATLAAIVVATAGTWAIRGGEFGFLQSWFGPPPETPGQYAGSWSQRLIYAYVGGRIFLDRPLLGTGWHGTLPPEEYATYLPDARERFDDQPPHYFPAADGELIPQQAPDQVLYELGVVGGMLFLALAVLAFLRALRGGLRFPAGNDWEEASYLPLAWVASLAGVLAGAALFGGSPIAAVFWLTLGVAAAAPALAERG